MSGSTPWPGRDVRVSAALVGCLLSLHAVLTPAAEPSAADPMPEWLTLEQAFAMAAESHPELERARAAVELAEAQRSGVGADTGWQAFAELAPATADPSTDSGSAWLDDSRARIVLSKSLYDFGRSRAREAAADAGVDSRRWRLAGVRDQHRLEVMERFFAVLLADMRYAVDNEEMAFRYVRFDKARERQEIGIVSDIDVLELEERYRTALDRRTRSANQQMLSRMALAVALNRPSQLPRDLVRPELPDNDRAVPDFEVVAEQVVERSSVIRALRSEVTQAIEHVAAARAGRRPTLSAEFAAGEFARELGSRDNLSALLNLRIPIYQGGSVAADVARAEAVLRDQEAVLALRTAQLRQYTLELVRHLDAQRIARESARVRLRFRDRYLDRARAAYELEMETTLGDSFTKLTEAQWVAEQIEFDIALTWAKLKALAGGPIPEPVAQETLQ